MLPLNYRTMYICVYMCVCLFLFSPFCCIQLCYCNILQSALPEVHSIEPRFSQSRQHSTATRWNTTGKPSLSQYFRFCCLHGKYLLLPATAHVSLPFIANTEEPFFCHFMQCCHGLLPLHTALLFLTAPPLPLAGSVTVQGLS